MTCPQCRRAAELRLYNVGRHRLWMCAECFAYAARMGADIAPAPEWIERAALARLPAKVWAA